MERAAWFVAVLVGMVALEALGYGLGMYFVFDKPAAATEARPQFSADQDARIAEHIRQLGFDKALQADLEAANRGLRNDTPPPWMLLAKYVDVLEKRVAELERNQPAKAKGE